MFLKNIFYLFYSLLSLKYNQSSFCKLGFFIANFLFFRNLFEIIMFSDQLKTRSSVSTHDSRHQTSVDLLIQYRQYKLETFEDLTSCYGGMRGGTTSAQKSYPERVLNPLHGKPEYTSNIK